MFQTKDEIVAWLKSIKTRRFTVNDDLTVDVDSEVVIGFRGLTEIPVQFGKVIETFDCSGNKLTSLKGSPKIVDGNFFCNDNQLQTLMNGPKEVSNHYYCANNPLMSLRNDLMVLGGTLKYVNANHVLKEFEHAYKFVNPKDTNLPVLELSLAEINKEYSMIDIRNNIEKINNNNSKSNRNKI